MKKGLKEKTTGVGDEAVNMKKGLSVSETKGEVIETEMSDFVDEESDPSEFFQIFVLGHCKLGSAFYCWRVSKFNFLMYEIS